ncbi:MAG: putative sulfate/molybdate transporter [Mycobacterium sp.]|nr:putative sulfate/molybdate transporter [Mycobacterium sp.]
MVSTTSSRVVSEGSFRFDWAECAGAVGDLGVLVPIAVALIVKNGLTPTAVLLPAGLLYVVAGLAYRLPVPVQPLKAFGAIAIAHGFGADAIAAGALLMGLIFLALGGSGVLDWVAKVFPHPIIRGIQLSVGLLFCQLAWRLVSATPKAFVDHRHSIWWLAGATLAVIAVALAFRRRVITLIFVALAVVVMVWTFHGQVAVGPSAVHTPHLSWSIFGAAAVALVLPQVPLSFANSCLATADTARTYFGDAARGVRPGRLATTIGLANLFAGAISGMPVCHGAGGMTAHRTFGARTGGAPIMLGSLLISLALALGATLTPALSGFPVPILAGLLTVAGLLHIGLLKDLRGPAHWALAIAVGITGFLSNLAVALLGALLIWWVGRLFQARHARREDAASRAPELTGED